MNASSACADPPAAASSAPAAIAARLKGYRVIAVMPDKMSKEKIDLLRAYGKFDVAKGTFSVYSEVKVHDGRIDGYVKPLFQDIQVYDPQKDKNKPVLKKLYEKVVGGVAHVLENHQREQVATVADLSGPVSSPHTSTWDVIVNLVSNAFVKAILPGFEREYNALRGKK